MHHPIARAGALLLVLVGALVGCSQSELSPAYIRARPQTPEAEVWEVRYDGEWVPVSVTGISPPTYLTKPILTVPNRFVFVGYPDTTWPDSLGFDLRAWNAYKPIKRQLIPTGLPDSTSLQMVSREDFQDITRYQIWSYTTASTYWPPYSKIESAPRGYRPGVFK